MTIAVNINKIAKIYSMNFFILLFFINSLKVLPKIAHKQIDGKQTKAAVQDFLQLEKKQILL